jgi:2-phosphosulfolactate phosphatase
MRLDVILTPAEIAPADLLDRPVVVLDILRATSSIVEALSAGARAIYPVASIEDALRLANSFGRDEVLLCGERKCVRIDGFDLGNSPPEFTRERVAGKTLVMSTTNGTAAMSLTGSASRVLIGSLLNLTAVVDELVRTDAEPVFLCSGVDKRVALEDVTAAGLMATRLMEARPGNWRLNDGAQAAVTLAGEFGTSAEFFARTAGGRNLAEAGMTGDLEYCARLDLHDLLPVLQDRNITLSQMPIGS